MHSIISDIKNVQFKFKIKNTSTITVRGLLLTMCATTRAPFFGRKRACVIVARFDYSCVYSCVWLCVFLSPAVGAEAALGMLANCGPEPPLPRPPHRRVKACACMCVHVWWRVRSRMTRVCTIATHTYTQQHNLPTPTHARWYIVTPFACSASYVYSLCL